MRQIECKGLTTTEYLLTRDSGYFHLDREGEFIASCREGPLGALSQTKDLVDKFTSFRSQEEKIPPVLSLKKADLLRLLVEFNRLRVDSRKLGETRARFLDQLRLEHSLSRSIIAKFKNVEGELEEEGLEGLDWGRVRAGLEVREESFKSVGEELLFFFEKLDRIESAKLKEVFVRFVKQYVGYLETIHAKINSHTSEAEAVELEEEISGVFDECPLILKKARELKEIAKNTRHLEAIMARIEKHYKVYDANKESLKNLRAEGELDIKQIGKYEVEFAGIYQKGLEMGRDQSLDDLNQMKKSIESYLAMRRKEKELEPLLRLLRVREGGESPRQSESKSEMLGKRESDSQGRVEGPDLKRVKTGSEGEEEAEARVENQSEPHTPKEAEGRSLEEEKEDSLDSLQNSELSDADSDCSNEYILKKRHKIRKLKSLIIRKKEEQNDLVNQSDERTSSFLHKKFSLMLLFFKLKVLGLDPETCSKTDTYLNTVKETDELMKKTSFGKVTMSELKQLIVKCEEMKYFSQGYQKFKRLQTLFKVFKTHTESLRVQFRGGLKITQEIRRNFLRHASLDSYSASVNSSGNGQGTIVLTRKQHSLFTKNSKKDWRNLNNKRKTKLRLGTDSFSADSKGSKKKMKEKLIHAIYGKNQTEYCLCRETFELTSMIQFTNCHEWFHKECIKIPKYQMKRIKTKNCPACFFLHESKADKFPHFRKRKIPFERFLAILKTAKVLSHFILDERLDEIFYIQAKLGRLESDLSAIKRQFSEKSSKREDITTLWTQLHAVALLYIYLPVKNDIVEDSLLTISKQVLKQLSHGQGSLEIKTFKLDSRKAAFDPKPPSHVTSKKISVEKFEQKIEEVSKEKENNQGNGKRKESFKNVIEINGSKEPEETEKVIIINGAEPISVHKSVPIEIETNTKKETSTINLGAKAEVEVIEIVENEEN